MEGKTFIFVVLSGLCFLPACFPHTYILVEQSKDWAGAQDYCRSTYTDLATINNQDELKMVMAVAQKYYDDDVWIGLYDDINSWRWSLEKEGYYGEGEAEAEFRMWKKNEPSNSKGFENCAGMDDDGLWYDLPCQNRMQFVCYKETPTSSSFVLVSESKTWEEAQSHCREHYTDLVSVRNQTENDQIKDMVQDQYTWIGLYRDSWKWSDGNPTPFRAWNSDDNQPNGDIEENCVLLHEGQWEDEKCDRTLYFVCHVVPVKLQVLKVKVTKKDSSVDLEDAAGAIMQQFNQTLQDHGPSEDVKLTWRKQPDGNVFYLEEKEEKEDTEAEEEEIICNLT